MKRLLTFLALTCATVAAFGATLTPIQLLNPAGSTAGQAIVSSGPATAPGWAPVTATALVAQAANTVVANVTGSSASPTAVAIPNCVGTSSAVTYTSGSGFGCNAAINALTLGGASFASPGPIGSVSTSSGAFSSISAPTATIGGGTIDNTAIGNSSASTGKFTTLSASSTVSGSGFGTYLASPPAIGGTASAAGSFTTLAASGNDALLYQTTNAQSIPSATDTTVTTWTKVFDRVNANFNASTGVFTAPVAGVYQVSAQLGFAANTGAISTIGRVAISANGVQVATATFIRQTATSTGMVTGCATAIVSLTAGQTITIIARQNTGGAVALDGGAGDNYLSINRLP